MRQGWGSHRRRHPRAGPNLLCAKLNLRAKRQGRAYQRDLASDLGPWLSARNWGSSKPNLLRHQLLPIERVGTASQLSLGTACCCLGVATCGRKARRLGTYIACRHPTVRISGARNPWGHCGSFLRKSGAQGCWRFVGEESGSVASAATPTLLGPKRMQPRFHPRSTRSGDEHPAAKPKNFR